MIRELPVTRWISLHDGVIFIRSSIRNYMGKAIRIQDKVGAIITRVASIRKISNKKACDLGKKRLFFIFQ